MSFKPIDRKRDQFRKYIESKGVIDMITNVLVKLLEAPEQPEHPIDFIRDNLGPTIAEKSHIARLEQELADYKQKVCDLNAQIDELKGNVNENNKPIVDDAIEKKSEVQAMAVPAAETESNATEKKPLTNGIENDESSDKVAVKVESDTVPATITTNVENVTDTGAANANVDEKVANEPETNGKEKSNESAETAAAAAAAATENAEPKN